MIMTGKNAANPAWGGRFSSAQADAAASYTDSESYDRALYLHDIRGSKAHAKMLAATGVIPKDDAEKIVAGLDLVQSEIESGAFVWKRELEDVHMNIEARLVELIGDAGKKLHTGRSRNDQVGLDFRLYIADACSLWRSLCARLCQTLCEIADKNRDIILPGLTHLQPAQPVSLAQCALAYAGMFRRDHERLSDSLKRIRVSPLGAAALAGSTYPLDPFQVAAEVGFERIYANSMDAVSDRDFALEALFDAAMIAMHLSRLCEELILWANPAFSYIELPDAFSTGSSIMPQKKNPDVAELTRGKTGRVYGNLMALLTIMKGLPLAYNRDMQEDKEPFFDTDATIRAALAVMTDMLDEIGFNPQKMAAACKRGYLNATELADYLAAKNVPFRQAHHIAGRAVAFAEKKGQGLEDMSLEDLKQFSPLIENDIFAALDYRNCVKRRETPGGTGPQSVARQIEDFRAWFRSLDEKDG